MNKIYIVVLTYNSEKYINRLLASIKHNFPLDQVIIVDNNSSDNTVSIIESQYPSIILIASKTNDGYGLGNNKGISLALEHNAEYIFIINPDVVLSKTIYKDLCKIFDTDRSIGIVGSTIIDEKGMIWSQGGVIDSMRYSGGLINLGVSQKDKKKGMIDVDYVSGTALMVKSEVFKKIGLFSKDYFLYYEDVDFSQRAKKTGFRLVINQYATVIHYASSSVGKNSPIMQYYMARNHLLFLEKFAPLFIKIRELIRLPRTLYQARNQKYELLGIRDYFLRRFKKRDYWN